MSLYFMSFPVAAFFMFATVVATRQHSRGVNGVEVKNFFFHFAALSLTLFGRER